MQGEISRLYYEYYRFAFDTARKAEKTMKQELMRPELDAQDFVKFNYWDGGRKGLLSGEALYLDVKRMEMAYHDHNKRELELTRHVSLRQLNPLALLDPQGDRHVPGDDSRMALRPRLPRSLHAPHQERRPLDPVRRRPVHQRQLHPLAVEEQPAQVPDHLRTANTRGRAPRTTASSITSARCSPSSPAARSNDSGMFETNLRDERFLPFEGAGAESTWKLDLPKDYPAFDYATISDVILHIRYTARQGVDPTKVKTALDDTIPAGQPGQPRAALQPAPRLSHGMGGIRQYKRQFALHRHNSQGLLPLLHSG